MSLIGKNIAIKRKEMNMTQEELARRMGYKSKSTINKIELGVNDIPQSKIVRFAEVLGTTPAFLMGWEEETKKNDTITDVIIRLRTDADFLSLVETLNELDQGKILGVKQMLTAFLE